MSGDPVDQQRSFNPRLFRPRIILIKGLRSDPECRHYDEGDKPGNAPSGVLPKCLVIQDLIDDGEGEKEDEILSRHGQKKVPRCRLSQNDRPCCERGDDQDNGDPEKNPPPRDFAALAPDDMHGITNC